MVRSPIDQLKADAFLLSKLLAKRKVKLSSQQCLDVLARLRTNKPYEALAPQAQADAGGRTGKEPDGSLPTLFDWMTCGAELTSILARFNRAEMRKAGLLTLGRVEGALKPDARRYMRASAVASDMFSRSAEAFVRPQIEAPWCSGLEFMVESLDPVFEGGVGKIIVLPMTADRQAASRSAFDGLRLDQQRRAWVHEHALQGEIACMLYPTAAAYAARDLDEDAPSEEADSDDVGLELEPGVNAAFSLVGQPMVEAFAATLAAGTMQQIWKSLGSFEVLVSGDASLGENSVQPFGTDTDPEGEKLASWCADVVAARQGMSRSDLRQKDEPRLSLLKVLNAWDSQRELEKAFVAVCGMVKVQALAMQRP